MGKKMPYLYSRLLACLSGNDVKKSDVISDHHFTMLLNKRFRLGKKDANRILDELEEMKFLERSGGNKIRII